MLGIFSKSSLIQHLLPSNPSNHHQLMRSIPPHNRILRRDCIYCEEKRENKRDRKKVRLTSPYPYIVIPDRGGFVKLNFSIPPSGLEPNIMGKLSTGLPSSHRRHRSRPAHSSSPESAFSSGPSSDSASEALSESSEGQSSEESSDGASSRPSDRLSGDVSREQRPLFGMGHQGPVFSFGIAKKSTSSDRFPSGWKSLKKGISHREKDDNGRPENSQIRAPGRIRNSGVRLTQLPSHDSRSSQTPLYTFFHHREQEAPLFAPGTGVVRSRPPILDQHLRSTKQRTRFTDHSQSKDRRSQASHREKVFKRKGQDSVSDGGRILKNDMGSIMRGTSRPSNLRSMELREQESPPAFRKSKRSHEQRGDNPIPFVRGTDNLLHGERETSPEIGVRKGRNPTKASRTEFSERHTKTGHGFKIVSGKVYMTGGADGGESLPRFDEMNDWWERELLNQTKPQPPDLRRQAGFDRRHSKTKASLKPILKNSGNSFTNGTTPAHSNPVRFVDSEGNLYWTLDD